MRILKYFSIFLFLAAIVWYLSGYKKSYQLLTGETFGTYYTIKVRSTKENNLLQKIVKQKFSDINSEMSVFDMNSEISEINRIPAGQWIALSADMSALLKNAYQIYQMSGGAFDPTTGRLIDLWGFGTTGNIQKIPDDAEIKKTLATTGFDKIQFSADFSRLRKKYAETTLNLSAIAKGYAVDRTASLLKAERYKNFIVEIGGEVYAFGTRNENAKGWNIGIADPSGEDGANLAVVTLKNYAVATSGDYNNFFYINDKKYSHTINPKTGYPVENNLISVTVFNKSCMTADGLATAIMSMGESKAANFISSNKLAVIMFVKDENGSISPIISDAAQEFLKQ